MRISSLLSRRTARRKGLTLVEILVVSVIFAIIATSLFVVFKAGLDSWRRTQAHLEVFQNARAALDMMTRELTAAYLNPANSAITFRGYAAGGASGWAESGASSTGSEVFFIGALNPSQNYTNAAFELCKVGYYMDNNTHQLMRYFYFVHTGSAPIYAFSDGTNVTYSKVAANITGFTLSFIDEAGTATTTWDSTSAGTPTQLNKKPSKVEITLTVQEPNSTRTQQFQAGVAIPQ